MLLHPPSSPFILLHPPLSSFILLHPPSSSYILFHPLSSFFILLHHPSSLISHPSSFGLFEFHSLQLTSHFLIFLAWQYWILNSLILFFIAHTSLWVISLWIKQYVNLKYINLLVCFYFNKKKNWFSWKIEKSILEPDYSSELTVNGRLEHFFLDLETIHTNIMAWRTVLAHGH